MKKLFSLLLALVASMASTTVFAAKYTALQGKFTVNPEGDQVRFSPLLLGANKEAKEYFFGGAVYGLQCSSWDTHDTYFAWGTGDDPGYTGIKSSFKDWGDNPIEYAENEPYQWRTLSADEWQYILSGRDHAEYLCGMAKVTTQYGEEYKGLMLFPDDAYIDGALKLPEGLSFRDYKANNCFRYFQNEYTYEQWKKLEEVGAVFLQTVYFCMVNKLGGDGNMPYNQDVQMNVLYWTKTPSSDSQKAKALCITIEDPKADKVLVDVRKDFQLAVRLVKDVKKTEPVALYGVKESDGKTMTLYYDDQRASRGGETDWATKLYENTTKIILDESMKNARPTNLEFWFSDFDKLTEIEHLDYLNTSEVTVMNSMFLDCYALKSLDLSAFNTKKVESMASMFGGCTSLTELNLNSLDVQKVTDMWGMFKGCTALKTIYCDNDWSKQLPSDCDSEELFEECTSLVGGNKTAYNGEHTDASYARPDEGPESEKPGYFSKKTPTAIDETPSPSGEGRGEASKILRDGQLLILRGDKIYTITGQEVR